MAQSHDGRVNNFFHKRLDGRCIPHGIRLEHVAHEFTIQHRGQNVV